MPTTAPARTEPKLNHTARNANSAATTAHCHGLSRAHRFGPAQNSDHRRHTPRWVTSRMLSEAAAKAGSEHLSAAHIVRRPRRSRGRCRRVGPDVDGDGLAGTSAGGAPGRGASRSRPDASREFLMTRTNSRLLTVDLRLGRLRVAGTDARQDSEDEHGLHTRRVRPILR